MGVLHDKWDNMDPLAQYALIGIAVLIVIHLIGLRMLVSPQQYKEDVTLRAAHRAFLEDADSLPEELVEYTWRTKWTRLLNFYSMKLHRNVPKRFEELRKVWGIDEDEYRREVSQTVIISLRLGCQRRPGTRKMALFRLSGTLRFDVFPL
jgi:hypothetical protein